MQLQTQMVPPNNRNTTTALAMPDDWRELGDRIANLTLKQAVQLARYLERKLEESRGRQ